MPQHRVNFEPIINDRIKKLNHFIEKIILTIDGAKRNLLIGVFVCGWRGKQPIIFGHNISNIYNKLMNVSLLQLYFDVYCIMAAAML